MMKPISRREYEEALQKQAQEDMSGHDVYRAIDSHQWRVFTPGTNIFAAYIAVMGPCVAVWGDIEGCFFAYGPKGQRPEDILRWLADSNIGYAREKASIGMTSIGHEEDNAEVALHQIRGLLEDYKSEREDLDVDERTYNMMVETMSEACDMLKTGHAVQEVREYLYEHSIEAEYVSRIGCVTTARVIYALEAVNKLVQLMEKR
jgi:hypothetical protein